MTKPIPGIKIQYFKESQYPEVEGTRCVEIRIPDHDAFMPMLGGLIALATKTFNYVREDREHAQIIADQWRKAYDLTDWEGCMNCDELNACLSPLYEAIAALQLGCETLQEDVGAIKEAQEANAAAEPNPIAATGDGKICGGATGVVKQMHAINVAAYDASEAGFVDNFFEGAYKLFSAIPFINELPADELFELVNWYFDNQKTVYMADYADVEQPMVDLLYCTVIENGGVFDIDAWTVWLEGVEALIPGNKAAGLFARYSPLRQTFLNQIAASLNSSQSLESYFQDLLDQYNNGKNVLSSLCAGAECAGDCQRRYSYLNGYTFELETGNDATPDPAGWYRSAPYTGFGNPNWVIGHDDVELEDVTRVKFQTKGLTKNPVNWNTLLRLTDEFDVEHVYSVGSGMEVVEDDDNQEFIVELLTGMNIKSFQVNTNTPGGQFQFLGLQICLG